MPEALVDSHVEDNARSVGGQSCGAQGQKLIPIRSVAAIMTPIAAM